MNKRSWSRQKFIQNSKFRNQNSEIRNQKFRNSKSSIELKENQPLESRKMTWGTSSEKRTEGAFWPDFFGEEDDVRLGADADWSDDMMDGDTGWNPKKDAKKKKKSLSEDVFDVKDKKMTMRLQGLNLKEIRNVKINKIN